MNPLQVVTAALLSLLLWITPPAMAARNTNTYDGNIFALYAGDGALVPPHVSLAEALAEQRPVLLAFFLDDSSASKNFAPLLSDLEGRWGKVVEVIALASDPFSVNPKAEPSDPSHYWRGTVPQLLVLDGQGKVLYDVDGVMESAEIEAALSKATGIELTIEERSSINFNEINSGYSS